MMGSVTSQTNEARNERIRAGLRPQPPPSEEPAHEEPVPDLGAGARPLARSGSDGFRRWLSSAYHGSRQESHTISARRRP
jgi:hypothetical protein